MILKGATSPSDRVIYQVRNFGFKIFKEMPLLRPCWRKIPTNKKSLKQWQKIDEMVANDAKMFWNGESDEDKSKYNSKNTDRDITFVSVLETTFWNSDLFSSFIVVSHDVWVK